MEMDKFVESRGRHCTDRLMSSKLSSLVCEEIEMVDCKDEDRSTCGGQVVDREIVS